MNEPVPLFSAQQANQGVPLQAALARVLASHWYVLGAEVAAFEGEFAAFVGVDHCVSVANGSDALEIALRALGIGPGARVATVANAGFYASAAIHAVGAEPLYVDVDSATLTMCAQALARAIGSGPAPAAVIVTHLYGQLADLDALAPIAAAAGVPLIEDCAQAHGATRDRRQAGSVGALACFSFYPTKNLGALGDGGAVLTRDAGLAARLRQLRQYGWSAKYHVDLPGGRNSRLDELQAAVLRAKLPFLAAWNDERRAIGQRYNEAFADLAIQLPGPFDASHAAHLYVVQVAQRAALAATLRRLGVSCDIHYPVPDHQQRAYPGYAGVSLPVTEAACTRVLSLPCYPGMPPEHGQRVIDAVRVHVGGGS